LVLPRQDWRHFQGRPWGGPSNGRWLLTLKNPLTVSLQFYLPRGEAKPSTLRIMNGDTPIRTVEVQSDNDLRVEPVTLPKGDVDLWFELARDDKVFGPYQVHLHF